MVALRKSYSSNNRGSYFLLSISTDNRAYAASLCSKSLIFKHQQRTDICFWPKTAEIVDCSKSFVTTTPSPGYFILHISSTNVNIILDFSKVNLPAFANGKMKKKLRERPTRELMVSELIAHTGSPYYIKK